MRKIRFASRMDYNQFNCVYVSNRRSRGSKAKNSGQYERERELPFPLSSLGFFTLGFFPSPCPTIAAILAGKADLITAYVQHTLKMTVVILYELIDLRDT